MRRVVLAGYYPPPMGGEAQHVKDLAQQLRTHGIPVEILNLRRGAPPSAEYRAASGLGGLLTALRRHLRPSTLLHLHTNGHNHRSCAKVVAAALALRMRGATGLLTLHSGLAPAYLTKLDRVGRALMRFGLASFAHVICVNANIRDAVARLGVPADRLSVVPAYLGLGAATPLSAADLDVLSAFTPLLVTMGGRDPEYGLPLVVDAVARLGTRFPRLGCLVLGSGATPALRRLSAERGVADRVVCVGEVAHERCLALLQRADVYVRPSYVDGDASSVREALALDVPVVATATDFRPDGVVPFRPGDVDDLCRTVVGVLRPRHGAAAPRREDAGARKPLLAIYARVGVGKG